jgi:hypothetical protein
MTTVFVLFSARTTLNCVLDMGNIELKHVHYFRQNDFPFFRKKSFPDTNEGMFRDGVFTVCCTHTIPGINTLSHHSIIHNDVILPTVLT